MEPRHPHGRDTGGLPPFQGLDAMRSPIPGFRYRYTPACGLPALRAYYRAAPAPPLCERGGEAAGLPGWEAEIMHYEL